MPSLAYELMDRQIDGGLASFIANLRSEGHSYRRIARQLSDVCGALVTDETVRRWHLEATDGEGDAA